MIFSAHQPNFFPWIGFFQKIAASNIFVVLDDVQYPRTGGGTYTNRTALLIGNERKWFTAPINKSEYALKKNNEITFHSVEWREKLKRTIDHHYSKAQHIGELREWLSTMLCGTENNLCAFNVSVLLSLTEKLGLTDTRIVFSSSLNVDGMQSLRLAQIGNAIGATVYLSGTGATEYMDIPLFTQHGLEVRYQNVTLEEYPQPNVAKFVPGLSILDILANCGFRGAEALIKSGR